MNDKEKVMLSRIINSALSKNEKKAYCSNRYDGLASCLRQCELHFDFPNSLSYNQNRTLITFSFKFDDEDCLAEAESSKKDLGRLCLEILNIDGKYDLPLDDDGEPKINIIKADHISPLPTLPKITFEGCEDIVTNSIAQAQHSIFGAVAWITNDRIIDALNKKAIEGVEIVLLVNDDKINRKTVSEKGINFQLFFAQNLDKSWFLPGTMHLKFCIIDNQEVIYGTFNWTNKAAINDEDVHEDKNADSVRTYLDQFKELRRKYKAYIHNRTE